jgi:hypothetical protein
MRPIPRLLAIGLGLVACSEKNVPDQGIEELELDSNNDFPTGIEKDRSLLGDDLYEVGITMLLANRDAYHGKRVLVMGVGRIAFESNGLFQNREHEQEGVGNEAIWLDIDVEKFGGEEAVKALNGQYVYIEGEFNANLQGHFDAFGATITNITRYERARK